MKLNQAAEIEHPLSSEKWQGRSMLQENLACGLSSWKQHPVSRSSYLIRNFLRMAKIMPQKHPVDNVTGPEWGSSF